MSEKETNQIIKLIKEAILLSREESNRDISLITGSLITVYSNFHDYDTKELIELFFQLEHNVSDGYLYPKTMRKINEIYNLLWEIK